MRCVVRLEYPHLVELSVIDLDVTDEIETQVVVAQLDQIFLQDASGAPPWFIDGEPVRPHQRAAEIIHDGAVWERTKRSDFVAILDDGLTAGSFRSVTTGRHRLPGDGSSFTDLLVRSNGTASVLDASTGQHHDLPVRIRVDRSHIVAMPTPTAPSARVELRLPPRPRFELETIPLPVPADDQRHGGMFSIATSVLPLLSGLAMAYFFRNPMYLMFTVLTPLMMVGSWLEGRVRRRKTARQAALESAAEERRFITALTDQHDAVWNLLLETLPTPAELTAMVASPNAGATWRRHNTDDDAWLVSIGTHQWRWMPPIEGNQTDRLKREIDGWLGVDDTPLGVTLGEASALGLIGQRGQCQAVARWIVSQLTAQHRPADLAIAVVVEAASRDTYGWMRLLPHSAADDLGVVSRTDDVASLIEWLGQRSEEGRHAVLIVDDPQACTDDEALRSAVGEQRWASVVIVPNALDLPPGIRAVADLSVDGAHRYFESPDIAGNDVAGAAWQTAARRMPWAAQRDQRGAQEGTPFRATGLSMVGVHGIAAAIATRSDGVSLPGGAALPRRVLLGRLLEDGAAAAGDTEAPGHLSTVLGVAATGPIWIDLVADGPHALVAGTTGAGKSELLRTWVLGLAALYAPSDVQFMLVDYKGGSAFDVCATLPHTVGVITDLDGHLGERALTSLDAELRRREQLLRDEGIDRIEDCPADRPMARLVIVIDEFATMAAEIPEVMDRIVSVSQRGRSLGVHLILATQRPAGVVNDKIRANTNLRLALRVQDVSDSDDVLGTKDAAHLPRTTPGRAIVRIGSDEPVTFQTALPEVPATGQQRATCVVVGTVVERTDAMDLGGLISSGRRSLADARSSDDRQERTDRRLDTSRAPRCSVTDDGDVDDNMKEPWLHRDEPVRHQSVEHVAQRAHERGMEAFACQVRDRWRGEAVPRPVWLPPLAESLWGPDTQPLGPIQLALCDDPTTVRQDVFAWDFAAGPLLTCGARGSGVEELVETIIGAAPAAIPNTWCYVLDDEFGLDRWQDASHVGEVIKTDDEERVASLITLLERCSVTEQPVLLIITNWDGLAARLQFEVGPATLWDRLVRLIGEGSTSGVYAVLAGRRPTSFQSSVGSSAMQRMWFAAADPNDLSGHVHPSMVKQLRGRGRCVVKPAGLLAQRFEPTRRPDVRSFQGSGQAPAPVPTMPKTIARPASMNIESIGEAFRIPVGVVQGGAETGWLEMWPGEHILVAGNPRSGKSQTLELISELFVQEGSAEVIVIGGSRSPLLATSLSCEVRRVDEVTAPHATFLSGPRVRPTVVVIDDADLAPTLDSVMAPLLAAHDPHLHVIASGHPERLRRMYGTWIAAVRSHRRGILLCPENDLDGEVLGNSESFRGSQRLPGRGYLIADGGRQAIQTFRYVVPSRGESVRSMTPV